MAQPFSRTGGSSAFREAGLPAGDFSQVVHSFGLAMLTIVLVSFWGRITTSHFELLPICSFPLHNELLFCLNPFLSFFNMYYITVLVGVQWYRVQER